jgi:hypothetical protein
MSTVASPEELAPTSRWELEEALRASLRELSDALAETIPFNDEAARLTSDAGIPWKLVNQGLTALDTWESAVELAAEVGRVGELLACVERQASAVPQLTRAAAHWREAHARGVAAGLDRLPRRPREDRRAFAAGVPFEAPPLPAALVERKALKEQVLACLLQGGSSQGAPIAALQGMGGAGKSTLASELAHELNGFPDGVLWVTLGQEPELLPLLESWSNALGDFAFRATHTQASTKHLRRLLHERACLLVVDDAWEAAHVQPFLVGGPRCRMLLTTRREQVALDLGANIYRVDAMQPMEAFELLSRHLGRLHRRLEESEKALAMEVVRAVGYLAIALPLVAVRIARGMDWEQLLKALEHEPSALEVIEGPRAGGGVGLVNCFQLSLGALRDYEPDVWSAFAWLGVLPGGTTVAAPMARGLWGTESEDQAARWLEVLLNEALLQPGAPVRVRGRTWPGFILHDLLHDMARRLLARAPPEGLGFDPQRAQGEYLQRILARSGPEGWPGIADDGYAHEHLGWHLLKAGRTDEFHALLRQESAQRRNAWYVARAALGQFNGYADNVERASGLAMSRSAEALLRAGEAPVLHLEARYALMRSSLSSLAGRLPIPLIHALVERSAWSAEHALAYAQRLPAAHLRIAALGAVADAAQGVDRKQATDAAVRLLVSMGSELYPSVLGWLCENLAPHLERQHVDRLLELAQGRDEILAPLLGRLCALGATAEVWVLLKQQKSDGSIIWGQVAPQVPSEACEQAIQVARSLAPSGRDSGLHRLATRLAELGSAERALSLVQEIQSPHDAGRALRAIIPSLPPMLRERTLSMARGLKDPWEKARTLGVLGAAWKDEALLREALELTKHWHQDYSGAAHALLDLVPYLTEELLNAARKFYLDDHHRVDFEQRAMVRMAELGKAAAALAQLEPKGKLKLETVAQLAPYLNLSQVRSCLTREPRRRALMKEPALLRRLAELGQVEEAVKHALVLPEEDQGQVVGRIASTLDVPTLKRTVEALERIGDDQWHSALQWLAAAFAPRTLLPGALAALPFLHDWSLRRQGVARLGRHLSKPDSQQVVRILSALDDPLRAELLSVFALQRPAPERKSLISRALATTDFYAILSAEGVLGDAVAEAGSETLERLVALLKEELSIPIVVMVSARLLALQGQAEQALELAGSTRNEEREYVKVLASLACHLPARQRADAISEVLRIIQGQSNPYDQVYDLGEVADSLPEELVREALATGLERCKPEHASSELAALACRLATLGDLEVALEVESALPRDHHARRGSIFCTVLEHSAPGKRPALAMQALEVISFRDDARSGSHFTRERLPQLVSLVDACLSLPARELHSIWCQALRLLSVRARSSFASDLGALAPMLWKLEGTAGIEALWEAAQDVERWWP